jgi:hypothetical protein
VDKFKDTVSMIRKEDLYLVKKLYGEDYKNKWITNHAEEIDFSVSKFKVLSVEEKKQSPRTFSKEFNEGYFDSWEFLLPREFILDRLKRFLEDWLNF